MFKWVNLSENPQKARYDFLSSYLNSQGVDNEWQHVAVTAENVIEHVHASMKSYDQILIDNKFGDILRDKLVDLSTKHYFSPTSDCLFKQEQNWFPRSYLEDVFIETLNANAESFDIQSGALIIGCSVEARIAINGFLKVGYTKFSVCDKDKVAVEKFFADFSKRNFNVLFKFVSQDDLAYLPGASSLMVNTMTTDASNDLLNDLFYFNYLNKHAIAIDLNLYPIESPLLLQARDLGIKLIDGYKFYAHRDFRWMQAATGKKFEWQGFQDAWLNGIKITST